MALTLSGDGSITGLAAGGLPDLSVGTSDIADAAITAAKMSGAQSGDAPAYAARAWVNFNGTGTVAIRASGNVSSITDEGTGNYLVNFATTISDANFAALATSNEEVGVPHYCHQTQPSTTNVRVKTYNNSSTGSDCTYISASIFR